ncbi:MAG: NUDIX hydrolase [Bacilli bacterium]|jgi:mutator protein MutT|nr:NUDIX hydrolase [Bacilli bacterium]
MKLLSHLFDDQYDFNGIIKARKIVRAIVLDEQNRIALTKINNNDKFGLRDYYELPGGGVQKGETLIEALRREMEEEIGCHIENIKEIGKVIDYYNLIQRENHNYFYLVKVKDRVPSRLEPEEIERIEAIVWVRIDEAIRLYEKMQNVLVGKLVKQRELPILVKAQKMINIL